MDLTHLNYCVFIQISFLFTSVSSDILDSEQSSFLGLTREVVLSGSTLEAVEQLEKAVYQHVRGDRRVKRYFDAYDTPFVGNGRRMNGDKYDDY
ncbi:uncharacterized protein LOC120629480 [Pararge aegeria]|uniref:uncharacterized protein LOC120629480 n=1 Tax=Pararge aegeria TaxID=116150 RepID=UPI0019D01C50|nr:uncharacterized protein LOC120629480 [Pararge aegeria]